MIFHFRLDRPQFNFADIDRKVILWPMKPVAGSQVAERSAIHSEHVEHSTYLEYLPVDRYPKVILHTQLRNNISSTAATHRNLTVLPLIFVMRAAGSLFRFLSIATRSFTSPIHASILLHEGYKRSRIQSSNDYHIVTQVKAESLDLDYFRISTRIWTMVLRTGSIERAHRFVYDERNKLSISSQQEIRTSMILNTLWTYR